MSQRPSSKNNLESAKLGLGIYDTTRHGLNYYFPITPLIVPDVTRLRDL